MKGLPAGWSEAQIGDLCDLRNGRAFKPTEWSTTGLPIVRIQNLNSQDASFNRYNGLYDDRYYLRGGELLFAWSGTPGTSFGAHIWSGGPAVLNQHIFRIDFDHRSLEKRFFCFAINRKLDELIDVAHGGVGLRHVTKRVFESTRIPIPPFREQLRIADKLDSVLGKLSAGRTRLDRVSRILKQFRQAVLEAAVSGRLTEEWRDSHSLSTQYTDFDAESTSPFEGYLVPGSWRRTCLSEIASVVGGITRDAKKQSAAGEDLPYLRVANVQRGYLDLNEMRSIRVPLNRTEELLLRPGDILFTEGGDLDKLGRGWIWNGELKRCTFQNHVFRARLRNASFAPKFFSYFANSRGYRYFLSQGKQTTNLASINKSVLSQLPVPIPPPAEQWEVVRRVDELFASADSLTRRYESVVAAVDRIVPAVLTKAFRGELVAQDPTDEPASVLLERIRAEWEKAETNARRNGQAAEKSEPGRGEKSVRRHVSKKPKRLRVAARVGRVSRRAEAKN